MKQQVTGRAEWNPWTVRIKDLYFFNMAQEDPEHPWRALFQTRLALSLLYCGRFVCPPEWSIEAYRLPRGLLGFFLLEKNDCSSVVNGRRLTLREGDLQVFRGGDLLSMRHDPKRPITALSLSLAVEQVSGPNMLLQRRFARRYKIRDVAAYVGRFNQVLAALQGPIEVRDWSVTSAVLQWLVFTLEQTRPALSTGGETAEGSVDRVLLAQAWASARLEGGLTLRQWAAAVKWHPVHFERVFKRATGQSPMKWLEDRRMQAARQYLSGTAKSVAEVASAVGYADSFYFSRVFRKHFGRAPAKYRKLSFELTPME